MNASISAKLLLIAGIAMQSTAINAEPVANNSNDDIANTPAQSQEQDSATQPYAQEQQIDSDGNGVIAQNSVLDEALSDKATLKKLEQENAALDAMLKEVTDLKDTSDTNTQDNADIALENTNSTETIAAPEQEITTETVAPADALDDIEPMGTDDEEPCFEDEAEELPAVAEEVNDDAQELDEPMVSQSTTSEEETISSNQYNFERTPLGENDIYIPILPDARVFAEFVDKLPAVVNYYTTASEEEVIQFYGESYGEPIEQERKRERLTLIYIVDSVTSRVVISQQDDRRQVDVIQQESL